MEESIIRLSQVQNDLLNIERKNGAQRAGDCSAHPNESQGQERDDDSRTDRPIHIYGVVEPTDRHHSSGNEIGRRIDCRPRLPNGPPVREPNPRGTVDQWNNPVQAPVVTSSTSLYELVTSTQSRRPILPGVTRSIARQNESVCVTDETRIRLAANAKKQREMEPVVLLGYTVGLPDAPHVNLT